MKNRTISTLAVLLSGFLMTDTHADEQENLVVTEAPLQEDVGNQYEEGKMMLERGDDANAVTHLRQAAEGGNVDAINLLGECYMSGRGVEIDSEKGVEYFRQAAELGCARAQANLGVCYLDGIGIESDGKLAILWCKRAAEEGLDKAMLNLALAYYRGVGVEHSEEECFRWLIRAAEKGDPEIQLRVALCLKQLGYDEQYATWLEASAASGCPGALFEQGERYLEGRGVEKNTEKAMELYQQAADSVYPPAQLQLGKMYAMGHEIPRDVAKAEPYLRQAVAEEMPEAAHILGVLYSKNELKIDNPEEVFKLYYIAAVYGGYVHDIYKVGICYMNGIGVEKDEYEGFQWLQQAAESDHPFAMYAIGECYEHGKGVEKDQEKAQEWYQKAADVSPLFRRSE